MTPGSWCRWGDERVCDGALSPRWLHPSGCNAGRQKEPFPAVLGEGAMLVVGKEVYLERVNEGEW